MADDGSIDTEVVLPSTPPLAPPLLAPPPVGAPPPIGAPPVPPPPFAAPAPPSPWVDSPLAPATWRLGGLALELVLIVCTLGVGWLAWWIVSWDAGRSPAKSILHIRVVRAGRRDLPGFGRMALREVAGKGVPGLAGLYGLYTLGDGSLPARFLIAASLAWLAMSGMAALLDRRRQALWDVFSGTIVVLDPDVTRTAEVGTEPR